MSRRKANGVYGLPNALVEDAFGDRGGIASVSVYGPQLANVNGNGQATSVAAGTQALMSFGSGGGPSQWSLSVALAVSAAGTSRLPLVENLTGPRDVYYVRILWNDGTVSGPTTLPPMKTLPLAIVGEPSRWTSWPGTDNSHNGIPESSRTPCSTAPSVWCMPSPKTTTPLTTAGAQTVGSLRYGTDLVQRTRDLATGSSAKA